MKIRKRAQGRALLLAVVLALVITAVSTQSALAHTRVEVGPYVIVAGWLNEPPIVGQLNALTIEVTENDEPVLGVESGLDVTILYGGRSYIGNLSPTTVPGLYAAEILPTVRGQYSVQLEGMIGDTAVDEILEPEEILPANVLQFPEAPPDTLELEETITELEASAQRANNIAFAGVGIGVAGLLLALFALLRTRRSA